jgi:hypothetical protein
MTNDDPFVRYVVTTLFHFTDKRNLSLIRQLGGLYSLAKLSEKGIAVPYPGGNTVSQDEDRKRGLDCFVHLCFKSNHPMEHVAREKNHIGETIFLNIDSKVLALPGVKYTPDVSNKSGVESCSLEEAKSKIDFIALFTYTNWNDPVLQQRRQTAEKCEILIPDHIPLNLIRNIPNG